MHCVEASWPSNDQTHLSPAIFKEWRDQRHIRDSTAVVAARSREWSGRATTVDADSQPDHKDVRGRSKHPSSLRSSGKYRGVLTLHKWSARSSLVVHAPNGKAGQPDHVIGVSWSAMPLAQPFLVAIAQELLAIVLGLASFKDELSGRKVVLYSDNKGLCHAVSIPLRMQHMRLEHEALNCPQQEDPQKQRTTMP